MSAPDTLPYITARTPRTSSKGSSPVSSTAVIKPHERPALISLAIESPISSPGMDHREQKMRKPSGMSAGSTTSSNKTHSSQGVGYLKKQDRTKTWCPTSTEPITSSKSDDQKLETLPEGQATMANDTTGHVSPTRRQRKARTDAASQFSKTPSKATNLSRRSVSTQDLSSIKRDKNNSETPRQSKKTKLQRYNSDQKLTDITGNRKNSHSTQTNSNQRRSLGYSSGDRDTIPHSHSRRTSKRESVQSSQMDETGDDAGYDSDEGRQDRIIQWLIGVETSCEERPPEPTIVDTGPLQTDTAIHIVYESQKSQQPINLSQLQLNGK
ncbi:serine/arginine-rich splicing factor 11-like [Lineus longissimus]|uniref:serine/arginine-rich splicing factor 11-like n=1 Tax=Lineus longissimus TaxID=88925 RepID=UPI00315D374C